MHLFHSINITQINTVFFRNFNKLQIPVFVSSVLSFSFTRMIFFFFILKIWDKKLLLNMLFLWELFEKPKEQMDRWTDGQMDRWTDRQMDRQTDGQTDRWQMNRQTDRETDKRTDIIKKPRKEKKKKQTDWRMDG